MNFRRYYISGSAVFLTQVVEGREPVFGNEVLIELLLETLRNVKNLHPFTMLGYVFLPDHFHLLIQVAGGNFSDIMHSLKPNFTKAYKQKLGLSNGDSMKFWQNDSGIMSFVMTEILKTIYTTSISTRSSMDM